MNLLFRIAYGTKVLRFSNGSAPFTHDDQEYTPEPIGLTGEVVASSESSKNSVGVKVPLSNEWAQDHLSQSITGPVIVTIFQVSGASVIVRWKGRATTPTVDGGTVSFSCESVLTAGERNGLGRVYMKQCPYALYSVGQCNVDKTLHAVEVTVAAVSGATLTLTGADAHADGWFVGGILEHQGVLRYVSGHVGNSITVNWPLPEVEITGDATLYPGCSFDRNTCNTKFNNIANYGGQPWLPSDNAFRMTSVV